VATATSPFTDIGGTTFEADIGWLYAEGADPEQMSSGRSRASSIGSSASRQG